MKTRLFTEENWCLFAGAEGWYHAEDESKRLPLISDGTFASGVEYTAIFDSKGVDIYFGDEVGNNYRFYTNGGFSSQDHAREFADLTLGDIKGIEDVALNGLVRTWSLERV